jgi:adenosine deaminase
MDKNQEIHNMKKVVLHLHLDGSLRPETVQEWLHEDGKDIDLDLIKAKLMVARDCKDLNQYLEKFDLPLHFLQSEERIKRASYELYEDLAKRNVIYSEVRFAPSLHLQQGLSYDQVVESAIAGMNEAKEQFGIDGGLILCAMRNNTHEANIDTVKSAKKYLGKGVVALDLAGAEALFPTQNFEDVFTLARENNIPFTIHAGEADGPESIKTALRFGAQRIGHGVRCVQNKELMEELKQKQILLEICPISNLQTQAVQGNYPLEEIYRYGIPVSINTDNDTVSNTDIEQEYEWVLANTSLTPNDLTKMNVNAVKSAFTTPEKKNALVKEILEQRHYEDEVR